MSKNALKTYKDYLVEINNFIFKVFLITYLVFLTIEYLNYGFIVEFFNINIILNVCLFSGVLAILLSKKNKAEKTTKTNRNKLFIVIISLISMISIFTRIKEVGWFSYIISLISGITIFLILVWLTKVKK